MYRFIDQFSRAKFSTWLYKITLNVTRDFSRKKQQNIRKLFKVQNERHDSYPEVESQVVQGEMDVVLHRAIQKLDEKYRIPIILFYFHEKKYEEMAEILGIPLSTVKTRLLRGKEMLKKRLLEEEGKEGEYHG